MSPTLNQSYPLECIKSTISFRRFKKLPENFRFIADGYSAYPLAAQQFFHEFGDAFRFSITQVIGLANGFDSLDGANYDLALWVAYYNFLRPHKHNNYRVLNEVELLKGADNMPGKWQLLIYLSQQTILNLQKQAEE